MHALSAGAGVALIPSIPSDAPHSDWIKGSERRKGSWGRGDALIPDTGLTIGWRICLSASESEAEGHPSESKTEREEERKKERKITTGRFRVTTISTGDHD